MLQSVDIFVRETDTRVSCLLEDGSLVRKTINPKPQDLLTRADGAVIDAAKLINGVRAVEKNLIGITDDFHGMTTDGKNKLHEI